MKLGDQPVHPTPWEDNTKPNGITLRQEFAKAAMQGLCCAPGSDAWDAKLIAGYAVQQADALIAELEKTRD